MCDTVTQTEHGCWTQCQTKTCIITNVLLCTALHSTKTMQTCTCLYQVCRRKCNTCRFKDGMRVYTLHSAHIRTYLDVCMRRLQCIGLSIAKWTAEPSYLFMCLHLVSFSALVSACPSLSFSVPLSGSSSIYVSACAHA